MSQAWQTHGRTTRDKKRRKGPRPGRVQERPAAPRAENGAAPVRQQAETGRSAGSGVSWRSASSPRPSGSLAIRPEDYSYVYSDLRRIAVLALCVVAVLVALTFVIK